jgi:hypothetical protein
MNRLAVERAKQESDQNPTEKRRHLDSSLQRWHVKSDDTAAWLHNLVFTSRAPPASPVTKRKSLGDTLTVTVEDYHSDVSTGDAMATQVVEKDDWGLKPIVWDEQTEPSVVADRLLNSWTTLTSNQVKDTHIAQIAGRDETWGADLVNTLEQHNKKKQRKNAKKTRSSIPPTAPEAPTESAHDVPVESAPDTPYESAHEGPLEFDPPTPPENGSETSQVRKDCNASDKPHKDQWVRDQNGSVRPNTDHQPTAEAKPARRNPLFS